MFRTWLLQRAARKSRSFKRVRFSADRRNNGVRPNIEPLEDRLVMTSPAAINAITADYALNTYLGQPVDNYQDTADGVGSWRDYKGGSIYWTAYTGAHEIGGLIYQKWQQVGGVKFGYPTTDETETPDNDGRFNHFALQVGTTRELAAIDWIYGNSTAHEVHGAIAQKFASLGWENFGEATTDETATPDGLGQFNHFQKQFPTFLAVAAIDWIQATGQAHEVHGAIAQKLESLGWENFGEATTDETTAANGIGQYNHFQKQQPWGLDTWYAIDWTAAYGAFEVHGEIGKKFFGLGAEAGLGEAVTDELTTADNFAKYNHFEKLFDVTGQAESPSAIDYIQATGQTYVVRDEPSESSFAIKFENLGWENGYGAATSDATPTGVRGGYYQQFENGGAIYYCPSVGTFELHGALYRDFGWWGGLSTFGYPTSDEFSPVAGDPNHRAETFVNGETDWRTDDVTNGEDNLAVYYLGGSSFRFYWNTQTSFHDGYIVRCVGPGQSGQQDAVENFHDYTGLQPNTYYDFSIDGAYQRGSFLSGGSYSNWVAPLHFWTGKLPQSSPPGTNPPPVPTPSQPVGPLVGFYTSPGQDTLVTDPTFPDPGQSFTLSWTDANYGGKSTGTGYVDNVTVTDPDGNVVFNQNVNVPALQPGYSVPNQVTIPGLAVGGDYLITVTIQSPFAVSGDNQAYAGLFIA